MALTPATAASLQILSSLSRMDGLSSGSTLQARVTAMLSNSLARLSIAGQSIDVATPKPLPVGAVLTLKAEWNNGQLTLQSQGPLQTPPNASRPVAAPVPSAPNTANAPNMPNAPPPQNALGPLASPLKVALANIQTMAVEAMLAGKGGAAPMPAQSTLPTQPGQTPPVPGQQSAPTPPGQQAQNMPPLAAFSAGDNQAAAKAAQRQALTAELLTATQGNSGADAANPAARSERFVSFTLEVPFLFPGSAAPLRLEIARDDQPDKQQGRDAAPRSWMVRFATEVGGLGMIHAAISLIDDHVGVQLWAERNDTAERFRQGAAELRDSLVASDLMLDTVRVAEGSPLNEL